MTGEQKNLYYVEYLQRKREIKRRLEIKQLQDLNKIDSLMTFANAIFESLMSELNPEQLSSLTSISPSSLKKPGY
ncbi:hypothetical protein BpHYR1_037832 [Brachionus plicatilis]|uniref:Uncharacterized protein n=1 Tax=Brachionus plicatilis TaxID=10195 RepID=A0A3M7QXY1_BRAPC|nr:hypothetical protein BpHYR1_037832 [Brachionus plicatilis]